MKNIKSNRTYFLLKGSAKFYVENEIIDLKMEGIIYGNRTINKKN